MRTVVVNQTHCVLPESVSQFTVCAGNGSVVVTAVAFTAAVAVVVAPAAVVLNSDARRKDWAKTDLVRRRQDKTGQDRIVSAVSQPYL